MLVRPQAGRAGLRVAALPPRGARSRCPALRAVAFLLTYQGRPHKIFCLYDQPAEVVSGYQRIQTLTLPCIVFLPYDAVQGTLPLT
jgi:hypothetical protein